MEYQILNIKFILIRKWIVIKENYSREAEERIEDGWQVSQVSLSSSVLPINHHYHYHYPLSPNYLRCISYFWAPIREGNERKSLTNEVITGHNCRNILLSTGSFIKRSNLTSGQGKKGKWARNCEQFYTWDWLKQSHEKKLISIVKPICIVQGRSRWLPWSTERGYSQRLQFKVWCWCWCWCWKGETIF